MYLYPGADLIQQDADIEKARTLAVHILKECEKQELSQFVVEQIPKVMTDIIKIQKMIRISNSKFTLDPRSFFP